MKRITLSLIVVFFAVNVFAQDKADEAQKAITKKDYKKAFTLGKEILESGNANDALGVFINLREVNYPDPKVYEYLGDAYTKMGVNELAIMNFEEAEKIDSLNIDLKFKTANLLAKNLSNVTPAINKYIKITQIEPQNSKAYFEAANLFFRAKQFIDAGKMYEEYLKLEKNKESYFNITKAFYEARSWEKTYEYGLKTLELYGENVLISKYVATAATQLKKYDDAAKYYSVIPDSMLTVEELERIGRIFQLIKDDNNSMKYFEKVVKAEPARSSIYMELANGFFRDKKYDEAAKFYEAKAKADSTNETAWRYLGFSHYQFKENADSNAANPNFKRNQLEKARVALLHSVALNDTNFTNRNFLIQVYTALDSTQALLNQHKEMLNLIGNKESEYKDQFIASNSALGYNAYERKAYAAAIPYYLRILKYKSDMSTLKILMSCYLQSGNNEEAIKFANRIKSIDPNDKDAKKVLRALSAD